MINYQILFVLLWIIPGCISVGALIWHARAERTVQLLALKANVRIDHLPPQKMFFNVVLSLIPLINIYCLMAVVFADINIDMNEKIVKE